jgi:hypothetical protein
LPVTETNGLHTISPDVPYFLKRANVPDYVPEFTTFFLGRETVIPTE